MFGVYIGSLSPLSMKAIHKLTLLSISHYAAKSHKGLLKLILPLLVTVIHLQAAAQCVVQTTIYDTTVVGTGTQLDPPYEFTLPKFDPSVGTLLDVRLVSIVTLSYSFTIENDDNASKTYGVRINREDMLSGPDGFESDFSHLSPKINYSLAATDYVEGSGPDFFSQAPVFILNQDTAINEVLHNTADFMGVGDVSFSYSSDVGAAISGGLKATLKGDAQDAVRFMVIYTYCDNSNTLADDIRSFTAVRQNDIINIRWLVANEQPGTTYELMKSVNGENYTTVKTFNASVQNNGSGEYAYQYVPAPGEAGKITFRIKQTASDGKSSYSELRIVDLADLKKSGLRLFPNPSRSGNVTIIFPQSGSWQVELYNAQGQMLRRFQENNNIFVSLASSQNKLQRGQYIVRVTNKKTNDLFTQRLIIE